MSDEQFVARSVVASQAELTSEMAIPLGDDKLLKGESSIDPVMVAAASLEKGQEAFVTVTLRSYPGFLGRAARWARELTGQEQPTRTSRSSVVGSGPAWVLRRLVQEARGSKKARKPKSSPPSTSPARVLTEHEKVQLKASERKRADTAHFEVALRMGVIGRPGDENKLQQVLGEMERGWTHYSNNLQDLQWRAADPYETLIHYMPPRADGRLVLSAEEVASMAHTPDANWRPDGLRVQRAEVRPLLPRNPLVIDNPFEPQDGLVPIGISGRSDIRGAVPGPGASREEWLQTVLPEGSGQQVIGMPAEYLTRHSFVSGTTGSGKSVELEWMNFAVAKSGASLVVIEPHGELVENLLQMLVAHCPERVQDIVVLDMDDLAYSFAFNPLDVDSEAEIGSRVGQVFEMLDTQLQLSNAPRAKSYVQLVLVAMCEANVSLPEHSKLTLLQLMDFFTNTEFRQSVMLHVRNHNVRSTFAPETGEYELKQDRERAELVAPISHRFSKLVMAEDLACTLGASKNKLDFKKMLLDEKKIVLINTAGVGDKQELGQFLSRLILPMLVKALPSIAEIRAAGHKPHHVQVCIDEAPAQISEGGIVMKTLAELRKFGMGLQLVCQYATQFSPELLDAIMSNTGSKVALRAEDVGKVGKLAKSIGEVGNELRPEDISSLPNYWAYANVLGQGAVKSGPFVVATMPSAPIPDTDEQRANVEAVRQLSRASYYNPVAQVRQSLRTQTADIKRELVAQHNRLVPKGERIEVDEPVLELGPRDDEKLLDWEGGLEEMFGADGLGSPRLGTKTDTKAKSVDDELDDIWS